ncbi:ARMT1-like domain-containing protein [Mucisphaera calidilacus]|uniref:Damage-control phosphatase ARMT1-like metal-binding domain-containing protein n=1 Tax=Mucisphaera calidilacus TaxID=2527982 RepID=A0A518BWF0_9BACT|nr:ARMT1-like domain-containing protein [Mucisphaera calidilacus]QDU71306.1 hypothetical protein Pan265_11550 [Mucisphaera calidilacus]
MDLAEENPCFYVGTDDHADPLREHAVFPLLADPQSYVAGTWDMRHNHEQRTYWLGLFRSHFPLLMAEARRERADAGADTEAVECALNKAQSDFMAYVDACEADPDGIERLDILSLCWARERALRAVGIADPYRLAKAEHTESALGFLTAWLEELDAMPRAEKWESLLRGVLAGNLFDLGATKTVHLYQEGGQAPTFHDTLSKLKPRPWFCDDADAFLAEWPGRMFNKALLFIDNAGPDVVLGMLPLARELARYGRVVVVANGAPSLNDVTISELDALLERVSAMDPTVAEQVRTGRMTTVSSGNWAPLIDLTLISPELAAEASDGVDLVVLEGMGRAIETNLEAKLTCDVLKMAMIKDEGVASAKGAGLFDLVCRFESAES